MNPALMGSGGCVLHPYKRHVNINKIPQNNQNQLRKKEWVTTQWSCINYGMVEHSGKTCFFFYLREALGEERLHFRAMRVHLGRERGLQAGLTFLEEFSRECRLAF